MVTIDTTSLRAGRTVLDLTPTAEDAALDEAMFSDIGVRAQLEVGASDVLVHLQVSATATLLCDRTLVEFKQPVSGEHVLLFIADEASAPSSVDPEDVRPLPEPGVPLDVTDVVRDTLILALPVRRVAPGADDEPIETVFGEAPASRTDPRWDALRKLRDKL